MSAIARRFSSRGVRAWAALTTIVVVAVTEATLLFPTEVALSNVTTAVAGSALIVCFGVWIGVSTAVTIARVGGNK